MINGVHSVSSDKVKPSGRVHQCLIYSFYLTNVRTEVGMFRREPEVREPHLDSLTLPLFLCLQEQFNSLFAQSCFGGGMSRSDSGDKGTSSGPVNYSPFFTLQPPLLPARHNCDRKGRELSFKNLRHYQRIIVSLMETARIMGEIDTVGV